MDGRETVGIERTRRIRRLALVSVITLAVLVLIAVGICSSRSWRCVHHRVIS